LSASSLQLHPAVDVGAIEVELQGVWQRGGIALVLVAMPPPYFFWRERVGEIRKRAKS